jgi:branched-chain amino acid transport system ATP-binding protein
LRDLSFSVGQQEIVGILGSNGVGKTTLLRAICGALPATGGEIILDGERVTRKPAWWRARHGIGHVPEGRQLFAAMTVEENLRVAARKGEATASAFRRVYEMFPVLRERMHQRSDTLSGGQQQMVAIGRALMTSPRVLLIDEMSAGLAPLVTHQLVEALVQARTEGLTMVVVEQSPYILANVVDKCYVLRGGGVAAAGTVDELGGVDAIAAIYLGGVGQNVDGASQGLPRDDDNRTAP